MSTTRPTGEQLRFRSSLTGDHVLDSYLEAAEIGGRTLYDLLAELFAVDGSLRDDLYEFRDDPENTGVIQYRVGGDYVDPDAGWSTLVDLRTIGYLLACEEAQTAAEAAQAAAALSAASAAESESNASDSASNAADSESAAASTAGAAPYDNSAFYSFPQAVVGSDGHTYRMLGTNVSGDDPVGSETGNWLQLTYGSPLDELADVAISGSYGDLINKPALGTAAFTDSSAYATSAQGALAGSAAQPANPQTWNGHQTFKEVSETVYTLTGTTPAIDPANGTVQNWTLTGNSSPTDGLTSGQFVLLMIEDGSAYTISWPTMTWIGGLAPALDETNKNVIMLWKVGSALYGNFAGVLSS